jgi:PhnB protein
MAGRAKAKKRSNPKSKPRAKARVSPIPEGFHSLTPYLCVRDAARAIEFYRQAFGASVRSVHNSPDGKVMNAELKIGNSMFMLNDEFPEMGALSPLSRGGSSVTVHIYCPDVDAAFGKAVAAGAKVKMPVMDMFWGDRYGALEDPFGHGWSIGTRKENLTASEVARRGEEAFAKMNNRAAAGAAG